jgi:hypothetical protein
MNAIGCNYDDSLLKRLASLYLRSSALSTLIRCFLIYSYVSDKCFRAVNSQLRIYRMYPHQANNFAFQS